MNKEINQAVDVKHRIRIKGISPGKVDIQCTTLVSRGRAVFIYGTETIIKELVYTINT